MRLSEINCLGLNRKKLARLLSITLVFILTLSVVPVFADNKLSAPTNLTYYDHFFLDGFEYYEFEWDPVEGADGYVLFFSAIDDPYDYDYEYFGGNTRQYISSQYHTTETGDLYTPGNQLAEGKTYKIQVCARIRLEPNLANYIGSFHYDYEYSDYSEPIYIVGGEDPEINEVDEDEPDSVGNYLVDGLYYKIDGDNAILKGYESIPSSKIIIPDTVEILGKTYPVTEVYSYAFWGQSNQKKLVIGKNVKSIGAEAFFGLNALTSITFKGKKITYIDIEAFKNAGSKNYEKLTVTVPKSKYKKYKEMLKSGGLSNKAKIKKK